MTVRRGTGHTAADATGFAFCGVLSLFMPAILPAAADSRYHSLSTQPRETIAMGHVSRAHRPGGDDLTRRREQLDPAKGTT
ncbi:MAG: hypothetical protein QOD35_2507 [Nocardioidaceae bacterium]|nr:hypothetical protein [Nocardioidaceae bacterium]